MANSRLEEYVQSATARLPESERAMEQVEMHQHLAALIAAHEELGDSNETATDAALKQLGDERILRQQLVKTHRRGRFHALLRTPLPEFLTIIWAPAILGPVAGGGILGAMYARGRLPLQRSSLLMAGLLGIAQTALLAGYGAMISQNWLLIGTLCALYWGVLTGCALLGFCVGNGIAPTNHESFVTSAKSQSRVLSLVALGSAVLLVGGAAGLWHIKSQQQERTRQAAEAVRVAEAQYETHRQAGEHQRSVTSAKRAGKQGQNK
jgi:hypothetical protein